MPAFSDPVVVCRPALPSDTADVLEFTKHIWEGNDYIRFVWRDWLSDPVGLLAIAQYGAHAVGIAKATLLSPRQWWLEGLRIDPKFQGLKIASHLHDYIDAWWLKHGEGTLRLTTSSRRVRVHHLAERTGFAKVGQVRGYEAPALAETANAFVAVEPDQLGDASQFILRPQVLLTPLMDSGWQFSAPDDAALLDLATKRRLLWWRGRQALLSYWDNEDDRRLGVGLVACPSTLLPELLQDVRRLAAQLNLIHIVWHAPDTSDVLTALEATGFTTDWDDWGYLYAKPHPTS